MLTDSVLVGLNHLILIKLVVIKFAVLCALQRKEFKENLNYNYWLSQHLSCFTVTAQLTPNVSVYLQYIRVPFVFGEVDRHSNCFFLFILGHLIH